MVCMKNKKWTPKSIVLAIVCFLVGVGSGLIGYHYILKPHLTEGEPKVEQEEIVREAVELVAESGKIPYKYPLKVLKSNLIIENEKVKEVHLTLDCGGKTFKAKVDWQNKKVISVENI